MNQRLIRRIDSLESENKSMLTQLKKLQAIVLQYNPSRLQAGTLVMVLVLSFSLFFVPLHFPRQGGDYRSIRGECGRDTHTALVPHDRCLSNPLCSALQVVAVH